MNTDEFSPLKILADGTFLKPGDQRTDHAGVLLPAAGIIVHPHSLGLPNGNPLKNHDACVAACRDLRVLGFDDWELARREDWNHVLDLTRCDPAVDKNLFPGIKPRWHWTATECAWGDRDASGRSPCAWGVLASLGFVYGYHRGYDGFALAVRRVGQ